MFAPLISQFENLLHELNQKLDRILDLLEEGNT